MDLQKQLAVRHPVLGASARYCCLLGSNGGITEVCPAALWGELQVEGGSLDFEKAGALKQY